MVSRVFRGLADLGVNTTLLLGTVGVFVVSLLFLLGVGSASRPPVVEVLVARRDLQPGDRLSPEAVEVRQVFADDHTRDFFVAGRPEQYDGVLVRLPVPAGQAVPAQALLSPGAGFAGLLPERHAAVFIPLGGSGRVLAPPADYFRPGDRVGVAAVLDAQLAGAAARGANLDAAAPPAVRELFPQGLPVLAVVRPSEGGAAPGAGVGLLVAVPSDQKEKLELAISTTGAVISILGDWTKESPTPGYNFRSLIEDFTRK